MIGFRREITFSLTADDACTLMDFPVRVSLEDPGLRALEYGGRVLGPNGSSIRFVDRDGRTPLTHRVVSYDPTAGSLQADVRLPVVTGGAPTTFYIRYGESSGASQARQPSVWDEHYVAVADRRQLEALDFSIPHAPPLDVAEQITVEAWVRGEEGRAEVSQSLVSKWRPLDTFDTFSAHDAGNTGGLNSTGYFGAVFDGRYVYFVAEAHEGGEQHGVVLRYDTHGRFDAPSSYVAYDAGETSGLLTRGFYGATFDGRYVYFTPRQHAERYHSRLLRYDTQSEFTDRASWTAFDAGEEHSQQGAAFDGRYVYFPPGFHGDPRKEDSQSGRVLRYDTTATFGDASSYDSVDITEFLGPASACFDGAAFDGRFLYLVPLENGVVARYDTTLEYHAREAWRAFNARPLDMGMCVGAVFDGRYVYFVPYGNPVVVRFDTEGEFEDARSWSSRDATGTGGLDPYGFDGGFFDGRFVYFVAFTARHEDSSVELHGNWLRHDPLEPFDDPSGWRSHDASSVDGLLTVGYNAGAFDGRYFYAAPWRHFHGGHSGLIGVHGQILRYDTLGDQGSFSLRYCDYGHNGGLCAAVRGPAFLLNTENGALSVAADRPLAPGWHHVAGVYDGRAVKLFVDGEPVAERSGSGAIVANGLDVAVGRFQDGLGRFSGDIADARISNIARRDAWIRATYLSLSQPEMLCAVGPEEPVREAF